MATKKCEGESKCCGKKCCGKKCSFKCCAKFAAKFIIGFVLASAVAMAADRGLDMAMDKYFPDIVAEYSHGGVYRALDAPEMKYAFFHPIALALIATCSMLFHKCSCSFCFTLAMGVFLAPFAAFIHAMFPVSCRVITAWFLQCLAILFAASLPLSLFKCCGKCCGKDATASPKTAPKDAKKTQ